MLILDLLSIVGIAIVLRVTLPLRFVRLSWYIAGVCLLLSIAPVLIMAYAVNFDKQFFLWFPIHPYYLVGMAFQMFVLFLGIVLGIVGKRSRALR
jgi:hypothetical protein